MTAHTFIKVDKATFYTFVQAQADGRYEYVRGRIMQQQGGTFQHAQIGKRFLRVLDRALDNAKWAASGSDRGVDLGDRVRYPDVVVEPFGAAPDSLSTTEPVIIVEVLSPSSGDRDLELKPLEYIALSSLQAYIVASPDHAACVVWIRDDEKGFPPDGVDVEGTGATIDIPELGLSIPLAEIYGVVKSKTSADKDTPRG